MKGMISLPLVMCFVVVAGCGQNEQTPPPSAQKNLKELEQKLDEFEQPQLEEVAAYKPMTQQDWERWNTQWNNALVACEARNGTVEPLVIGPPATRNEIESLEKELGTRLPISLRFVLATFAGELRLSWELPDEFDRPDVIQDIFSGGVSWSLNSIKEAEQQRHDWEKNTFSNSDDEYDAVWHDKLGFLLVSNGDVIAFDLKGGDDPPVIYLSNEAGELHGYRLGDNFIDFINRWTHLGCPGPVDWQMSPFLSTPKSGFVIDSENARTWRTWFGLE